MRHLATMPGARRACDLFGSCSVTGISNCASDPGLSPASLSPSMVDQSGAQAASSGPFGPAQAASTGPFGPAQAASTGPFGPAQAASSGPFVPEQDPVDPFLDRPLSVSVPGPEDRSAGASPGQSAGPERRLPAQTRSASHELLSHRRPPPPPRSLSADSPPPPPPPPPAASVAAVGGSVSSAGLRRRGSRQRAARTKLVRIADLPETVRSYHTDSTDSEDKSDGDELLLAELSPSSSTSALSKTAPQPPTVNGSMAGLLRPDYG